MSDGTKSGYTKTGKKVMCINSNRRDLTYKKVYDVFTTQGSVDFIIDDDGDKRYERLEFPHWCEKSDGMVDKANETKLEFKVGDTVKVVDIGDTSQATSDIKVGDVGVITHVISDYDAVSPNRVEFDDECCWFTDKCIELVDDTVDTTNDINDTNGTKPKFKVGDKVKVVNIDYISQCVDVINVGDTGITGVIINIDDNDNITPYLVKLDELGLRNSWWFTDKCIELVEGSVNDVNTPNKKYNPLVVQQSGNHYKNGEIQPIEYSERNNLSTCQGNIVKYITRHKEKNGVDDLAKIVHYALLEALFVYGEDGATVLRDKVDSLINVENKE